MTQEDKELLLKDLCARLNNKIKISTPKGINILTSIEICLNDIIICSCPYGHFLIEEVKPYLRPMSSMTVEECIELGKLDATFENIGEILPNIPYYIEVTRPEQLDFLNAHNLDYRGLIEKGLAIEAPKEMYI